MPNNLYSMRLSQRDEAKLAELIAHHGVSHPVDIFRLGMNALLREREIVMRVSQSMLTVPPPVFADRLGKDR